MSEPRSIAFLGIGLMGHRMVTRLLAAGHSLTVWNRTPGKARAFADRARVASHPGEAVAGADLVITMLENGDAVEQVLMQPDVLGALSPGATVVDMSSISPAMARSHGVRLASYGVQYLDAPVSGGTLGAEQGRLSIMAGGDPVHLARVEPVLQGLGGVIRVGPVGAGQLAKLANQAIVACNIAAVAEALLLAQRGGADPVAVREALLGGFAGSRVLELHGQRMLARDFTPGAPARIQLKDLNMILAEAEAGGLTLPMSRQALKAFNNLVEQGHGELDHSSLLLELERLNPVPGEPGPENS
ncbi:MAG: NAD(P)-dependent oxidoreductase [Halomonadaceae bacterium]|nr:MAG: NAD(P)-dependent oxidoreductase [Halomonadaceae bacterium]